MIVGGIILDVLGVMLIVTGIQLNRNAWAQFAALVYTGSWNPGNVLIIIGGLMLVVGTVLEVLGAKRNREKRAREMAAFLNAPVDAPSTASAYAPPAAPAYTPPTEPAYAPPTAPAAPVTDTPFRLQCLAGSFAGKRFPIDDTLTIGRDAYKCGLVFPQRAGGISGIHCELKVMDGSVWLKDLGSTYGTFIQGGVRLAAGQAVRLDVGAKFWLGSENELFEIVPKGCH